MANTFTKRVLLDGPKTAVIHAWLASDGAAGELTGEVLVDAASLSGEPTKLTVERVEGNLVGFSATLLFDATTDVPFVSLPDSAGGGQFLFKLQRCYAGIADPQAAGATGNILISTAGFSAATDRGHLIIVVRKD